MSVAETMKAITDCAKKLIEAPRYNVGDFIGVYGYETDVRIHDIRWEGSCFVYKVYLADEETWLYDEDIAHKEDEMIEGLVEEETKFGTASNPIEIKSNANCLIRERVNELATKIDKELPSGDPNVWELPDGYQFVDENGNVINATKIVLEKKKEYPTTYEECAKIFNEFTGSDCDLRGCIGYMSAQLTALQKLLICRAIYWKIYGDEMGLGKPWEPDWPSGENTFCITAFEGKVVYIISQYGNIILAFPTEEMRDAFYENFKELIDKCKELL